MTEQSDYGTTSPKRAPWSIALPFIISRHCFSDPLFLLFCCVRSTHTAFFGHTSRVWDCKILSAHIISISEDTTCRVWTFDGVCQNIITGHSGKNIWSLDVSPSQRVIATGGGDCAIRLAPLLQLTKAITTEVTSVALPPALPATEICPVLFSLFCWFRFVIF